MVAEVSVSASSSPALGFDPIAEAQRQWDLRWERGSAMAAATSIMRAQQIVLAAVDGALRPFGLTFARWEALVLLSFTRTGALPLGKMGERLMVHPTSVTNTIDRLEGDGLVARVPHPTDRRATLAQITAKGRRLAARATAAVEAVDFGLPALDEGELASLTDVLRHLRAATGDFPA
jgi:DNA-binding MarR family transcriptional regulator